MTSLLPDGTQDASICQPVTQGKDIQYYDHILDISWTTSDCYNTSTRVLRLICIHES